MAAAVSPDSGHADGEHYKRVPETLALRELIRAEAADYGTGLDRDQPLPRDELERHGRELLRRSIALCCTQQPSITDISVNSSPNAVPVYEKLGFVRQQSEQENNGIRFVPMQLALQT